MDHPNVGRSNSSKVEDVELPNPCKVCWTYLAIQRLRVAWGTWCHYDGTVSPFGAEPTGNSRVMCSIISTRHYGKRPRIIDSGKPTQAKHRVHTHTDERGIILELDEPASSARVLTQNANIRVAIPLASENVHTTRAHGDAVD